MTPLEREYFAIKRRIEQIQTLYSGQRKCLMPDITELELVRLQKKLKQIKKQL